MIETFDGRKAEGVIAFERVAPDEVTHYGIASPRDGESGEVFELADLVEKPEIDEAPSNLAVAARYVLSPVIFDYLRRIPPGKGDEIQLTDAVRMLIRDGGRVLGVSLAEDEKRFDIGNFESYFEAFVEFALSDPLYGAELRAKVAQLLAARRS
jgi:UTP--glucose-1-phosphate uridylyltransferase